MRNAGIIFIMGPVHAGDNDLTQLA